MELIGLLIVPFIIILAFAVFMIITQWKIYTKAGKPGWTSIVPIYNYIVMLEIVGKPWWTFFMLFIPIYGIVVAIQVVHGLSKSFGKDAGFTCGLIFLPIIFYPILAFSDAKYVGPNVNQATTA